MFGFLGDRVEARLLLASPRRAPRLPVMIVVLVVLVMRQFNGSVAEIAMYNVLDYYLSARLQHSPRQFRLY